MRYQIPFSIGIGPLFLIVIGLMINGAWPTTVAGCVVDDLRFPYQAIVVNNEAMVHSGPGKVHYATQTLSQGDVVTVYREDPGGWCAIRPLDDSFSLVPEATLERLGDGNGRITQDGTQAWVGTMLGAVDRPLWQVKLKKGELVSVRGQVSWPDARGHSTVWYQISPPSGEFRWVRIADIQLPTTLKDDPSTSGGLAIPERDENTAAVSSIRTDSWPTELTQQPDPVQQTALQTELHANPSNTVAINGGWRQSRRPIQKGRSSIPPAHRGTVRRSSPNQNGDSRFSRLNDDSRYRVADADLTRPNFARDLNAMGVQTQVNGALAGTGLISTNVIDLETLLTMEMLKEKPEQWELTNLENTALTIFRNSPDSNERALLKNYLDKIANCKEIQSGYRSAVQVSTSSRSTGNRPIGTGVTASNELDAELASRFDAHGWLNELKQGGGSQPSTYVLQNATGTITHHVAAPGLNLHRYLKSRIGVIGLRGYHNRLKLDHVTIERVVVLEKPR